MENKYNLTTIVFKSESSDTYVENFFLNNVDDIINKLKEDYGEEFCFLNIETFTSEILNENEFLKKFQTAKNEYDY